MGKSDLEYQRYKLYVKDNRGRRIQVFGANSIEQLDEFTKQFSDEKQLLDYFSKRYETKFSKFYVESMGQKSKQSGKIINDIVYSDYVIPPLEQLHEIYMDYLLDDRNRIRKSFARYKPKFANENVFVVGVGELRSSIRAKIKGYMNVRNVYFELVKNGYIKVLNKCDNLSKKYLEPFNGDYTKTLINNIDTDYPDIKPEKLTDDDVDDISNKIMIEKVKNGEVEPFEYYDLDDYLGMQGRKK